MGGSFRWGLGWLFDGTQVVEDASEDQNALLILFELLTLSSGVITLAWGVQSAFNHCPTIPLLGRELSLCCLRGHANLLSQCLRLFIARQRLPVTISNDLKWIDEDSLAFEEMAGNEGIIERSFWRGQFSKESGGGQDDCAFFGAITKGSMAHFDFGLACPAFQQVVLGTITCKG